MSPGGTMGDWCAVGKDGHVRIFGRYNYRPRVFLAGQWFFLNLYISCSIGGERF